MFGLETILRVLAPHDCMVCAAEGALLCPSCLLTEVMAADQSVIKGLDRLWIGAKYQGVLRKLIRRFKFDRAKDASWQLAEVLKRTLPTAPPELLITYVPTATSRVRGRGYDHAKQLAKCYARMQGRKIYSLLHRTGQVRQVGASRQQRLVQLEAAFRVRNPEKVRGQDILLIDDVVTTGATLQMAAKTLMRAGAKSVSALVVAQKQ